LRSAKGNGVPLRLRVMQMGIVKKKKKRGRREKICTSKKNHNLRHGLNPTADYQGKKERKRGEKRGAADK